MNPFLLSLRFAPTILRRIVEAAPAGRYDTPLGEGRFSLREVVCHVGDLERINRERIRRAVEEEVPHVPDAEPDRLAVEGRYSERDIAEALASFEAERRETLAYLEGLTGAQLDRCLTKSGLGTIPLREFLVAVVSHDQYHLEQASGALVFSP